MMLVATASSALLASFGKSIEQFSLIVSAANFESLQAAMVKIKPRLTFIDFELPGFNPLEDIEKLHASHPNAKIIGIGQRLTEEEELKLFISGMRGYCSHYVDQHQFIKMIAAVLQGEVWMSRSLAAQLLKQLQGSKEPSSYTSLTPQRSSSVLTQREKEIAQLVGKGYNNRQIALALDISERTVKSHLTEIFRKLSITDRLALALWVTSVPQPPRQEQRIPINELLLDSDFLYDRQSVDSVR